jgi:alkanesulfonate monooxygenase SsuD/methylene tetrahydromethanopterin reductase-like flavin-dependent oxidoreductase (luciferase family)
MKVNWFHLMPYRWLPDDFREKYRSVWVDIPSSLWDARKGHHLYNEYLDELEFAEKMGMDGICVNEHHSNGYGLMPSPNIMAACLARRTSRADFIVLGNSLALYHPPLRVAEEFALLDLMSDGRLDFGVGAFFEPLMEGAASQLSLESLKYKIAERAVLLARVES